MSPVIPISIILELLLMGLVSSDILLTSEVALFVYLSVVAELP